MCWTPLTSSCHSAFIARHVAVHVGCRRRERGVHSWNKNKQQHGTCQITKNILSEFKEKQGGGGKGEKQEVEELGNEVRRQERKRGGKKEMRGDGGEEEKRI